MTTATATEINFLEITKTEFKALLNAYFQNTGGDKEYYYNQSCAIQNLLEKFGIPKAETSEMVREARKNDYPLPVKVSYNGGCEAAGKKVGHPALTVYEA